jgi:hypothetical protein
VYSWFHLITLTRRHPGRDFKRYMIGACVRIVKL